MTPDDWRVLLLPDVSGDLEPDDDDTPTLEMTDVDLD